MDLRFREILRALGRRPILVLWLQQCRGTIVAFVAHFLFMMLLLGPLVRFFVPEPKGPKLFGIVQLPASKHDPYPAIMAWLDPILWIAGWSFVGAWAKRRIAPAMDRAHQESEALEAEANAAAAAGDVARSLVLLRAAASLEPSASRREVLERRRREQQRLSSPLGAASSPGAVTTPPAEAASSTAAPASALEATLVRSSRRSIGQGGRIEIVRELGRGATGVVYLAEDTLLGRKLAVKQLTAADDGEARARFWREARALAQLSSPHIVQVYDLLDDGGRVYLCMEYCAGGDLATAFARGRPRREETLRLGEQIARALAAAHAEGIVHRDLKPANVLRAADGTVKVGDFGLARLTSSSLTLEGTLMGTPAYMAPEQALGRQVDARTDLYALGCILFEALVGKPCYEGGLTAVLAQHASPAPAPPLAARLPDVPPALAELVDQLRAKEPDARPAFASEVAAALARLQDAALDVAAATSS